MPRWRVVAADGAPFRLVALKEIDPGGQALQVTVESVADEPLRSIGIVFRSFESDGVRKGVGFVIQAASLLPGRRVELRVPVPLDEVALTDTVLMAPMTARFGSKSAELREWRAKTVQIEAWSLVGVPRRLSGHVAKLEERALHVVKIRDLASEDVDCSGCAQCLEAASTCGELVVSAGRCRTAPCVSSYTCTCKADMVECKVTCKAGAECC